MRRRYTIQGQGFSTSATRRFLIVGVYGGAPPHVETTADDPERAAHLITGYRRDFPHTRWFLIDQSGQGGD